MLTLIFLICMFGVFGKLLGLAIKMTWGITKVVLSLVFLPVILLGLVLVGLIHIAFPILVVIGILAVISSLSTTERHYQS